MYIVNKDINRELLIRESDGASIPFDEDNSDYQAYLNWIAEGNQPLLEAVMPIDIQPQVEAWINQQLDEKARQAGYDSIIDACSFVNSTNIIYRQDAKTLIALRDTVWMQYHGLQADVKIGKLKLNTVEDWLDALTALHT